MKLSLKVVPGSSRDEIAGWLGDSLKIRVRTPAESGKANAAVIKILAATLGLHKRAVTLLSGKTSTRKIVEIDTLTEPEVHAKLDANHD
jgi:uncharacterized protein (TIGR00251 family)